MNLTSEIRVDRLLLFGLKCFCENRPIFSDNRNINHFHSCIHLFSCPEGWGGGGGTCKNFDRDARPIILGLKFDQILFFCCWQIV